MEFWSIVDRFGPIFGAFPEAVLRVCACASYVRSFVRLCVHWCVGLLARAFGLSLNAGTQVRTCTCALAFVGA